MFEVLKTTLIQFLYIFMQSLYGSIFNAYMPVGKNVMFALPKLSVNK